MALERSDIDIDWELELKVFLFAAEEIPDGLYELPGELGIYQLTLPERLFATTELIRELLKEHLITIDKYASRESTEPTRSFALTESHEILDNFFNWFPNSSPLYSISVTELGGQKLESLTKEEADQLRLRLFGTKKHS